MEEGDKPKYSVSIIIPKSDTETIAKIEAAVEAATLQFKAKNANKVPGNFKLPLRDGDVDKPDDPAYENSYFLTANSDNKPGVVSAMKDKDGKPLPITEEEEFYSGCYGRASINFYPFGLKKDVKSKGVACGLNNLQKVKDGERLGGGRSAAEDDFAEDLPFDDDDDLY